MASNNCTILKEDIYKKKVKSLYNTVLKRILDFLASIIFILLMSPFIFVISLIQVITSGFPIFYRPLRGGYRNKPFKILKFRTMVKNADKIGGGTTALNDTRITKFGYFLRKTKLDEIPQILNVMVGQMSIIGPRPELIKYTDQYDDLEKYILYVRPGITDYSSIHFINLDEVVGKDNADEIYEQKVLKKKNVLRLEYVEKISFRNDLEIFIVTILKVFKKTLRVMAGAKNGKSKNKK